MRLSDMRFLLFMGLSAVGFAQTAVPAPIAAARELLAKGEFREAQAAFVVYEKKDPKSALAMMGEGGQRVEAEHRARALQRVQPAEHRVDQADIVQAMAEIEQPLLDLVEQLRGLDAERRCRILAHRPSTLRATLTSWSGTNGLTSQPVAPAALACAFISASDSVVRKMIGTPACEGC